MLNRYSDVHPTKTLYSRRTVFAGGVGVPPPGHEEGVGVIFVRRHRPPPGVPLPWPADLPVYPAFPVEAGKVFQIARSLSPNHGMRSFFRDIMFASRTGWSFSPSFVMSPLSAEAKSSLPFSMTLVKSPR